MHLALVRDPAPEAHDAANPGQPDAAQKDSGAASLTSVKIRRAQIRSNDVAAYKCADIFQYWTWLRAGRRFPSRGDLDPGVIGHYWPGTMLLRIDPGSGLVNVEAAYSGQGLADQAADGGNGGGGQGRQAFGSEVTEWILSLAQEVGREQRPLEDTEDFPTLIGSLRYRVVVLPLSDDGNSVERMLCYVGQMG
jgi:hypothetical protein